MAEHTKDDASSSKDLTIVPHVTFSFVEKFIGESSKSLGTKEISKGYKYFSEKYVTNISIHVIDKSCVVKAKCHRSQRKNESPHDLEIILVEGPHVQSSSCSCAIGKMGTCGHITGLLYTIAHMKSSNLKSVPSDILKTSLPQTWHMPRGEILKGSNVDDIVVMGYDSQSPYRQTRGLRSTLYNPIKSQLPPVEDLLSAVDKVTNQCLLMSVATGVSDTDMVETKFGKYQKGSPLSYQQKLSSHYILNLLDNEFPSLPVENFMDNEFQCVLDEKKTISFHSICVNEDECHNIEAMTRLQSNDPKWHAVRRDRITASVAGDIVKRRADNEPLVARLKTTRKVVTESMRHDILFEAVAANTYAKMQNDNVNVFPYSPWLAASPDRKVYNPSKVPPYGLLEIKCPVKPLAECVYLTRVGDQWTLKKKS